MSLKPRVVWTFGQKAAARDLFRHIAGCRVCSSGDDGCAIGQRLESRCIYELKFDPYRIGEEDEVMDMSS